MMIDRLLVDFRGLRLVDVEEILMRTESFELNNFQSLCMRHVEAAKDTLLKK